MIRFSALYIGFFLLLSWGCRPSGDGNQAAEDSTFKPAGNMADLVYNPVRPDGSIDSSYLPILKWKENVYDFGVVFEGDVVTREYHFTNTGTAPLLINRATSTCGCTVPEWPKTPIAPDSTGSITVKFNTLNKPGAQSKEVTIFANTFPNSSKLVIKGMVDSSN